MPVPEWMPFARSGNAAGRQSLLLVLGICMMLFHACSPTRKFGPNQYLLEKNIIKTDRPDLKEGVTSILKQKPNRKILGVFRFHLGVYTLADHGKPTKFKNWFKNTIGEEPVVLDPDLTIRSREQVEQFMQNEGFFNATVTDTTTYKRKRARVTYRIKSNEPYRIRNIRFSFPDSLIAFFVLQDTSLCRIKSGNRFRTDDFQKERERVTRLLKNRGYFDFNQLYISFDIDSALQRHQVDVKYIIDPPAEKDAEIDSNQVLHHKMYRIRDIYVATDFDPLHSDDVYPSDTIIHEGIHFITYEQRMQVKPEALFNRIYIERHNYYMVNLVDRSYAGLAGMGLYKFINIRFERLEDTLWGNWLNCRINLTPTPKQSYKVELEGTNNGGNFGFGINLLYNNKNIFRGGETFEIKWRTTVESIPDFTDTVETDRSAIALNTYELGPEFTLRIPRFLWPLAKFNRRRASQPVTFFTAGYNFQKRNEYTRNLFVLSSGFEFRQGKYVKHYIYPAEINYTNYQLTEAFTQRLIDIGDQQLILYYKNTFITNGRYVFVFNDQQPNRLKNFGFLRIAVEFAGNTLRLYDELAKPNDTKPYTLFGVNYAQYVRPEFDLRYYQLFSEHTNLVYRLAAGLGIAYLNSQFIPYEKAFFAGGSNDLRAFKSRTLGPGSYETSNQVEHLGEIKINANVEYRFDIFKVMEGALFADAGNVWSRKEIDEAPGANFAFDRFYEEFAVGAGFGIRLDLQFFIIRLDTGFPLRIPDGPISKRWVFNSSRKATPVYNLGIGYPF